MKPKTQVLLSKYLNKHCFAPVKVKNEDCKHMKHCNDIFLPNIAYNITYNTQYEKKDTFIISNKKHQLKIRPAK